MAKPLLCWNCGSSLAEIPLPISRHANCPKCYEVLRCCRLCLNYAPGRPADCNHERADPPVIKETANFCDYFKPNRSAFDPKTESSQISAVADFDSLFSDTSPASEAESTHDPHDFDIKSPEEKKDDGNPLDSLFDD
ncbi:MAG: hypothetical protein ABGY96_27925 [bacterium]|nr:hypothetical protein [Gammaproteobacteria bacterium]HIL94636.1 hypothetical protein [Pseudomonadales bacterium]